MNKFRRMNINPETAKEVEECATIRGMRKRINEYAYRCGNGLCVNVFRFGEATGLSGEDTMTMLAFEALKRLEIYEDAALKELMTKTPHQIITDPTKLVAEIDKY